jgi:hypothetical protein
MKRAAKKKEPVTYEDFLAEAWDQWGTRGAQDEPNIPESNYDYKVGESVKYGSRPDCRVEEVLQDGKLIHISSYDKGETYGTPYDNLRRLPILVWWTQITPLTPMEDTNFRTKPIFTHYTQNSLDGLVHQVYHRGLIASPDYQRDYVWTLADKQRLIQSIFNHADIGKFLFLEYPYPENRLEVVDGKQRLNAICEFIEGRFEFKGKTWFQLSTKDKGAFFDLMVQSGQLDATRVKKSDVLALFLSINAGGVPQTEEHIAKTRKLYEQALEEEADAK